MNANEDPGSGGLAVLWTLLLAVGITLVLAWALAKCGQSYESRW